MLNPEIVDIMGGGGQGVLYFAIDVAKCAHPGKVMRGSPFRDGRTLTNEKRVFHNEIK